MTTESKQQGHALVSSTATTVDTREAIQQVYQVGNQHWMYIFAKGGNIVLRLMIVGSPEDLQDYRREINTFIANVHFRGTPTAENSNEEAEASSGDEFTYLSSGLGHFEAGEYAQAITDFDEAIRLNSNSVVALMFRGNAYGFLGQYDQAFTDCDQAIRLDPANTAALFCRANAYKAQGNSERAIADLDSVIRIEPRNADAYYYRGLVYYEQDIYPQAIADFDQAILLDPDYADAYFKRGLAHYRNSERSMGLADLKVYVRLAGEDADLAAQSMITRIEAEQDQ